MLAQMSCTELSEWEQFYADEYFATDLIDAHFSRLSHHITDMVCKDHGLTIADFSLLNPQTRPEADTETSDEAMMLAAEGITGGIRYGPGGG